MTTKLLASALLASTMLIGPALAQTKPATPAQTQSQMQNQQPAASATMQHAGQMRSSNLVGLSLYNQNNDHIGDINELIIGRDGQVQHVIVGVGGFLGIGERDVALSWKQVRFMDEPRDRTTAARPVAGAPATTANTAANRPAGTTGAATTAPRDRAATGTPTAATRDVPDHAVVDLTKAQLEKLPQYKYAKDR